MRARRANTMGCRPCRCVCVCVQLFARVSGGLRSPRSCAHGCMSNTLTQAHAAHTCATHSRVIGRLRESPCGQRGGVRAEGPQRRGLGGKGGVPVRCGRRRRTRAPPSGRVGAVRGSAGGGAGPPPSHLPPRTAAHAPRARFEGTRGAALRAARPWGGGGLCDGGQSREDTLRGVGGAAGRAERYCGERLRGGVDAVRGGEPGGNHEERAARSGGGAPCGGVTAVGPRGRALSDPGRPSPPSPPPTQTRAAGYERGAAPVPLGPPRPRAAVVPAEPRHGGGR